MHEKEPSKNKNNLKSFRILTFALNLPGPLAIHRLANLGVQVTKIEPLTGDPLHHHFPDWYAELHKGIEVRKIDLSQPSSISEVRLLCSHTDLILTAQKRGWVKKLKDFLQDPTAQVDLGLKYVHLVGYLKSDAPAHDLNLQASAGLLSPTVFPKGLFVDYLASERLFSTCVLLLMDLISEVEIEIEMESLATYLAEPFYRGLTSNQGLLGGSYRGYRYYRASDGWIVLCCLEPHFERKILESLGLSIWDQSEIERTFLAKPIRYWQNFAETQSLPISVVREANAVLEGPSN